MRDNGGTQSSGQKEEPEGFVRWNEQKVGEAFVHLTNRGWREGYLSWLLRYLKLTSLGANEVVLILMPSLGSQRPCLFSVGAVEGCGPQVRELGLPGAGNQVFRRLLVHSRSSPTWRSQKDLAFGVKAFTAPPLC